MAEELQIQPLGFLVGANGAPEESKGKWGMIGAFTPSMISMLHVMSTAQLEARIAELEAHDKNHAGAISKIQGQMITARAVIAAAIKKAQCDEPIALLKEHFTDECPPCTVRWAFNQLSATLENGSAEKANEWCTALSTAIQQLENGDLTGANVLRDQLVSGPRPNRTPGDTKSVRELVVDLFQTYLTSDGSAGSGRVVDQAMDTLKAILPGGAVHLAATVVVGAVLTS